MQRNTLRISSLAFSALLLVSLTGCFHKHTFADATCTEPKTCTVCGETEGEPLGHTCEIGTCKQCGEFQNSDLWKKITDYIDKADQSITVETTMIGNSSDPYFSIVNSQKYVDGAQLYLSSASTLCGSYKELVNLRLVLHDAAESVPSKLSSSSSADMINYLNQLTVFVSNLAYAQTVASYIS